MPYTAPMSGYRDAADYYYRASSLRVAAGIRVPTLIITALDDPFIPIEPFRDPAVTGNPAIRLVATAHGGHCGFVSRPVREPGNGHPDRWHDDGYWAERMIVAFAREQAGRQLSVRGRAGIG